MALIEWGTDLSVEVPAFDEQHKKLIDLLNQLHDAMLQRRGREVMGPLLDELLSYTNYHFAAEARAFDRYQYPECAKHLEEHQKLLETARELKAKHDAGSLAITVEVMDFLKKWVAEHIRKCDKLYTAFFADKQVEG